MAVLIWKTIKTEPRDMSRNSKSMFLHDSGNKYWSAYKEKEIKKKCVKIHMQRFSWKQKWQQSPTIFSTLPHRTNRALTINGFQLPLEMQEVMQLIKHRGSYIWLHHKMFTEKIISYRWKLGICKQCTERDRGSVIESSMIMLWHNFKIYVDNGCRQTAVYNREDA